MNLQPSPMSIQPYRQNRRYWQLDGQPVLLLGGSVEDNLFQIQGLEEQLDLIASAGGNVIRNTMSDRDPGDARAFLRGADGLYDLRRWNDEYWSRFESLLDGTRKRGIVVQIEVWDRFDHSRKEWLTDPWNPANNRNYGFAESGFAPEYPNHPLQNEQPFFFTVPEMEHNRVVLPFQQDFVRQVLAHSLRYDHVLYCMDNETTADEAWGAYWAGFIRTEAARQGKRVYLTEMWDTWDVKAEIHGRTIDRPDRYDFIDLSQNSQIRGWANWQNAQHVWQRIAQDPRPINSTKIYGCDAYVSAAETGKDTRHAISCFWRNILGGFASSRFHRPTHGIGISPPAQDQIRTACSVLNRYTIFRSQPDSQSRHLTMEAGTEAHLTCCPGEQALVLFPVPGAVRMALAETLGSGLSSCRVVWVDLLRHVWQDPVSCPVEDEGFLLLDPPSADSLFLALVEPGA